MHIAVREGEISEEDARREGDEMRRNLEREIHAAHRRIDFEAQERRIHQSIEDGRMSEEDGERLLGRDAQKNGIGREKDARPGEGNASPS